jgi:hypothetical protein
MRHVTTPGSIYQHLNPNISPDRQGAIEQWRAAPTNPRLGRAAAIYPEIFNE